MGPIFSGVKSHGYTPLLSASPAGGAADSTVAEGYCLVNREHHHCNPDEKKSVISVKIYLDGNPIVIQHTVKAVTRMDSNFPATHNGNRTRTNGTARHYAGVEERCWRILNRSELLAELPEPLKAELIQGSALVDADRREAICMASDPAIFVIGSGRVRRVTTSAERELTLGYYGPGDILGELCLVDPDMKLQTVVLDYVEALRIPPSTFRQAMKTDVSLSLAMHKLMAKRRVSAEQRLDALLTRSVESRVAEFLLDAAGRHGIPDSRGVLVGVKFTHQEIACYVGSTRETVTLVLGAFKRANLVATDHRRIVIRDREKLATRI